MEKVEKLLKSRNFDDVLIGLSILDNLPEEELINWCESCTPRSTCSVGSSSDFVLPYDVILDLDNKYQQSYIVGKTAYYYFTGSTIVIDFEDTYQKYNLSRKITESWR